MSKIKLTADLDRLIKRAAEVKASGLKQASDVSTKLDNAEDGTVPATTGAHAAQNVAAAGEVGPPSVDGGAKDNKPNGSVEKNTDGSAAASTTGDAGPKGGDFPIKSEADNGPTKGEGKFAGVRKLANDLRAAADAMLTNLDKFLVKSARASTDKQVKTAADAMADDELSGQASDALMEQIASGQVSDEDATQILQEAVQAGAITPEELQEAASLTDQVGGEGGEGGAPAPEAAVDPAAEAGAAGPIEGDPAAAAAPLMDPAAADPAAGPSPEDQMKMAAAQITPEHPKYLEKLASIYDEDMNAGYHFFNKLAEVVIKNAEKTAEEAAPGQGEKKEEQVEGAAHEGKETPEEEKKEELIDAMSGVDLKPADAAEQQALEAVKQELGLNDAQLQELAAAQIPAGQDKVASAKAKYRAAIMAKVAALKK
jgi:hypothetical protein